MEGSIEERASKVIHLTQNAALNSILAKSIGWKRKVAAW